MRKVIKSFIIKLVPGEFHLTESIQANLLLCQGYVPESCRTIWTQNSCLQQCCSRGVWGGIDNFILYSAWLCH